MSLPGQPFGAASADSDPHPARGSFERTLLQLRRRLVQEATVAVGMLESALECLWNVDCDAAKLVRGRDDGIDREEVEIEQECYRVLSLQAPVARDLRTIMFILKVNQDIERVADHACSIAKIVTNLQGPPPFKWPTALVELGQRVPVMCHALLRAVLAEDAEAARQVKAEDKTIDALDRRLFDEVTDLMRKDIICAADGLLMYRAGRELERVGDLMVNIAEDTVYLATGSIIRHAKKRAKAQQGG